jgi:hypothetical protein
MAYAFVQDVAASWERYELETAVAIYPAPEGLILHLAGPGLLVYPKAERDVLVTFQVGRARCTIVSRPERAGLAGLQALEAIMEELVMSDSSTVLRAAASAP